MKSSNSNVTSIHKGVLIRAKRVLEHAAKQQMKHADAVEELYPKISILQKSKVLEMSIQMFCLSKIMKREES